MFVSLWMTTAFVSSQVDYRCSVLTGCRKIVIQGSHASWKVLESPEFFFLKIPVPGKSWKSTGPGKDWKNILENYAFLLVLMENKQK